MHPAKRRSLRDCPALGLAALRYKVHVFGGTPKVDQRAGPYGEGQQNRQLGEVTEGIEVEDGLLDGGLTVDGDHRASQEDWANFVYCHYSGYGKHGVSRKMSTSSWISAVGLVSLEAKKYLTDGSIRPTERTDFRRPANVQAGQTPAAKYWRGHYNEIKLNA